MENELFHYGTPRHSGRYPWGSGENPYQHEGDFLAAVNRMKKEGLSETEIAKGLDLSTTELRAYKSIAKDRVRAAQVSRAIELKEHGYSNMEIGRRMGINESQVRSLLKPVSEERANSTKNVADFLKKQVDEKKYIDIGPGVEQEINSADRMGVSRTKLKTAVAMLKAEGYEVHYIFVDQLGTQGNKTTVTVLAPPGTEYKDIADHKDQIHTITDYSRDGGSTFQAFEYPSSVSSDRIKILLDQEGGSEKDGVIELRRGVKDLSLGNSNYAQVRIAVDDSHYMKGMAIYSDNMPDGVDIIYNSSKTSYDKALKPFGKDPDNPFGTTIKAGAEGQSFYEDPNGKYIKKGDLFVKKTDKDKGEVTYSLSPINKVNDEGDWGEWSKTLASQFLSKQAVHLAEKQLNISYSESVREYEDILKITNSAVRKKLLMTFADECDAAAVHLKAAALPRQATQVILPVNSLKENEIFAPNFDNGEQVMLVRYPHGGKFEIPVLFVNNRNKEAKSTIGPNARDAVGIHHKVAEQLSGADFDGDTVLVIPTRNISGLSAEKPLPGLVNFNPREQYKGYEGMPEMSDQTKQTEMGKISNLITDMTIKGAERHELERAVKHSMVVIDAQKHKLNYRQSYIDNDIASLKKKYQDNGDGKTGASTLISRASAQTHIPERQKLGAQDRFSIDPETGKKIFYEKTTSKQVIGVDPETGKKQYGIVEGNYYIKTDNKGNSKKIFRTQESTQMLDTDDAFTLSSGTLMEDTYAAYANRMKALANEARKSYLATPTTRYSPEAKKVYEKEVSTILSKLNEAEKNAPRERQAQILANEIVNLKTKENDYTKAELKKIKGQALATARNRLGAKKPTINLTDKEWEAIQAGAISNNTLTKVLNNADMDRIRELATPISDRKDISSSMENKAKSMAAWGYTNAEIAKALGISATTVSKIINGKE